MDKYYTNAEYNATFDRCIDVMTRIILKYDNQVLESKTLCELLEADKEEA